MPTAEGGGAAGQTATDNTHYGVGMGRMPVRMSGGCMGVSRKSLMCVWHRGGDQGPAERLGGKILNMR